MSGHYVFNASAIGLGGVLTLPKRKVIPSLASVALAPTGGEGASTVTNYDDGDGITFDRAETRVFGSNNGKNVYATRADVLVNNLDVYHQLQVEQMWASVMSVRQVLDDGSVRDLKFTFQAGFVGVRVNGNDLEVPVDMKLFDDNASHESFVKALGSPDMAEYRKMIGLDDAQTKLLANADDICCTAVSPSCRSGHRVPVAGVGTAYLAEALVKQGRRRLTLLRLELNPTPLKKAAAKGKSAAKEFIAASRDLSSGSMTVGSVEGNGTNTMP